MYNHGENIHTCQRVMKSEVELIDNVKNCMYKPVVNGNVHIFRKIFKANADSYFLFYRSFTILRMVNRRLYVKAKQNKRKNLSRVCLVL